LTTIAAILGSALLGIRGLSRVGDLAILILGVVFAVPVGIGPYLARRKGWLSFPVSLGRSVLAAIPLPLLPAAFFIGMIGWGDMQEHLIRRVVHVAHRELPDQIVGVLIAVGLVIFGAIAVGSLVWISVSVLTRTWNARMLLILWTGCAILSGLFWDAPFVFTRAESAIVILGLLLVFAAGFLFAFAVEMNATVNSLARGFRYAATIVLVAVIGGGSILIAKSVPEKRFPRIGEGPVWTFSLASTGCRPAWGGPDSSAAANEIAFAANETLGMAFETSATALADNKWKYESCIFTVATKSGTLVAQISVPGHQPTINGKPDGNFKVRSNGVWTTYSPDLKQVGEPEKEPPPGEHWTAARWHAFRTDSSGKLWFDGERGAKLLGQYVVNGTYIHLLGAEHVLVTAGRRFSLFGADGAEVLTEQFTRERVNFAAVSADHRRFAVAIYLWGVGDPSYLEEEKIVVYDSETGKAVAAMQSDPLPMTQSWTALSPDGTRLAVGAQTTLRLFDLPPAVRD
jgi:hypothetical protein